MVFQFLQNKKIVIKYVYPNHNFSTNVIIINIVSLLQLSFLGGVSNYEAFESRASSFNKIMDALRDENVYSIGVVGIGGVGKTTLVKQVAQQAMQHHLFTMQVYFDLSSTRHSSILHVQDIQRQIAEMLGWESKSWYRYGTERAIEMKKRLKNKKILIILDDIWREIDLEGIGIPSCKDDDVKECKVMFTRRDEELLYEGMGTQICFPVETLPLEEAWTLFNKTAGACDSMEENQKLRSVATQVIKKCKALPLAIVTIAKALKDESMVVWENALEQLKDCAASKTVNSCLEWCYTHLKQDDLKSLLLLCGSLSYDGDISMDHLLQYAMGLDLFDRVDSLEQARNRLLALVEILKASSWLLEDHRPQDRSNFDEQRCISLLFTDRYNKFVRMHDVVSDVVREIASKDPHPFIVRQVVGLEEWSETNESKNCTFISVHCKAVDEQLPQALVCPKLNFFLLHKDEYSLNIPNKFFQGMKKLQVLDLSRMDFEELPSSLNSLANLRTLRLDWCFKLKEIIGIGKLTKLLVLSLVDSGIRGLPDEMAQLSNLRLLNLNNCKELNAIPQNILSSLSRLECLDMTGCSKSQWAVVEGDHSNANACLSDLNHLSCLTTLFITIPYAQLLPKDILFDNLTRYAILIGDSWHFRTNKALKLHNVNRGLDFGDGIIKLLERSEELVFSELSGTKFLLSPSNRMSFAELKHLDVSGSSDIQFIIDSTDQQFMEQGAFPLLESLFFRKLKKLEEVWHGPIPIGPFGNLKTLAVDSCPKLRYLFWLSTARGLSLLESMKIEDCEAMQQVIAYGRESEDKDGGTNLELFPNLRTLELINLPQLISFSSKSTNERQPQVRFFNHKVR